MSSAESARFSSPSRCERSTITCTDCERGVAGDGDGVTETDERGDDAIIVRGDSAAGEPDSDRGAALLLLSLLTVVAFGPIFLATLVGEEDFVATFAAEGARAVS